MLTSCDDRAQSVALVAMSRNERDWYFDQIREVLNNAPSVFVPS